MSDERAEGPYAGAVGSAKGSDTSQEAADQAHFASALRTQIFELIRDNNGYTRGELFDLLAEKYQPSTISARISELQLSDDIRDSGVTRFNQRTGRAHTVWVTASAKRTPVGMKKGKLLDRFGNPLSDSYCTPRWLTAMLPVVDVDPCSNPRSTVRSRRSYSLEKRLDGLALPWNGSVFLNWPYSAPEPWALKLINELEAGRCTEAIVLCKLDSSTAWWHTLVSFGLAEMWTFDKRILFDEPPQLIAERVRKFAEAGKPGGEKSSTNFASTIIHHRGKGAPALQLEQVATRWVRAA